MSMLQGETAIDRLQSRFYYGWVHVLIAAFAMVGTLPGRTQGLGLITEPLLRDLGLERIFFAQINLWATLIGSLFCVGIGRLIDRYGSRRMLTALAGNFLGGWLSERWSMNRLMALAMTLLSASLLSLPHVSTQAHVVLYAVVMGLAGGFVIVLFFSFWSRTYGRRHLGKIQGAAQTATVLASAVGPYILAICLERTGSYAFVFYLLSAIVFLLAISAWIVPVPFSREGSGDRQIPEA